MRLVIVLPTLHDRSVTLTNDKLSFQNIQAVKAKYYYGMWEYYQNPNFTASKYNGNKRWYVYSKSMSCQNSALSWDNHKRVRIQTPNYQSVTTMNDDVSVQIIWTVKADCCHGNHNFIWKSLSLAESTDKNYKCAFVI